MRKIKNYALVAALVLTPYVIYYPIEALGWMLDMAFLSPERWETDGWAHPDAEISLGVRIVYFAVWVQAVVFGMLGLACAARCVRLFWCGIVFDLRVAAAIKWIGVYTILSNGAHILAASVSPMLVSWHNPDGPLGLRFWYSSQHLALILYGLGFVLMGVVLREAIKLARENEGFI